MSESHCATCNAYQLPPRKSRLGNQMSEGEDGKGLPWGLSGAPFVISHGVSAIQSPAHGDDIDFALRGGGGWASLCYPPAPGVHFTSIR